MTAPKAKNIDKTALYIWDDTNKEFIAWDGVLTTGDIEIGAVELKDGDSDVRADIELDSTKNALYIQSETLATEAKQDDTITAIGNIASPEAIYPVGSGSNGSVTLTDAATAYAVPATASTEKHVLVLYNGSDTDIYWGFANSNSNGLLLPPDGKASMNMGVSQQVYAYCASAGKAITYSYKEIA